MERMLQESEEGLAKKRTEVGELEKEHAELKTRLVELQLELEAKNSRDLKTALESIDNIRRDLTEMQHNNGATEEQILNISCKLENVEKAVEETMKMQLDEKKTTVTKLEKMENQAMVMFLEIRESKKVQKTETRQKLKIIEKALEEQKQLNEKLSARLDWLENKRTILVLRGIGSTKELQILDRETSQWKTSSVELPEDGYDCGMICLEKEIYIFGGCSLWDKTYKLNKKMKWDRMADMNEGRTNISFLLFDGCIWVFGGKNRLKEDLNTVEKYIPSENKWIKMPPMKRIRRSAAASACGGKIYVCGGCISVGHIFKALKSVECFDQKEEIWTMFVDLPTPAVGMGVISDGGCLIIYGGSDAITFKNVWKINPNDANPEWKGLPSMTEERRFLMVQSIGKRIFAIGGHGRKSVEIFNGTSWEYGPELPEICWAVPSVVIPHSLATKLLPI